jgi:hypothetical protein
MYLEKIKGGDADYLQALVRFPNVSTSEAWWRSYERRISAAPALRELSSAYRLRLREDGSVERMFSAVFDPRQEKMARRFFASFIFLESLDEDSVELPEEAADFEAWAGDLPKFRHKMMPPILQTSENFWLACDFRVAAYLASLISEAQTLGFSFAYQAHFRPFAPDPDMRRRVGRNLLALQNSSRAPSEILRDQKRQVDRFSKATFQIEEIIYVDDMEGGNWLVGALARSFRDDPARGRLDPPTIEFGAVERETDAALMMHSSLLFDDWTGDDLFCSQAEDGSFRKGLLSLRPALDPKAKRETPGSEGDHPPEPPPTPFPPDVDLPPPFEGRGHVFISYRRLDLRRIAPIMRRLCDQGLPIWYDRGIAGGEEWDEVLERKIEEAGLLLIFLSQAAVESKYCRREIKFADAINIPLMAVTLETVQLSHGLKFMLQQLQMISAHDHEFETILTRSIKKLLVPK